MTIYFDNNATTPPLPEVVEAVSSALRERWGNPSSLHAQGEAAAEDLSRARRSVAGLVGCSPRELCFTSGGSEAIATALASALPAPSRAAARRRVLCTSVEHAAVLEPLERARERGVELVEIGVDSGGALDWERLERELDERCALVSVLAANNETGVLFDVPALSAACARFGARLHVDLVQMAGKLPVDLPRLGADYASLSAHKLHGPKGVGALFVRGNAPFEPLLLGGGQEGGRRSGTPNVPGIAGFGAAARAAREWLERPRERERAAALRDRFEAAVLGELEGVERVGKEPRLWNTANLRFVGLSGEALVVWLSAQGLCASTGAACSSGKQAPSHVLTAMGLSPAQASSCVRFSLSRLNTADEVERAVELVAAGAHALRAFSA